MKISYELEQGYIDVWNEESEEWDRYIKVNKKSVVEENKIPERVPNAEVFEAPKLNNMELSNIALTNKEDIKFIKETLNQVLDYLKSKGE